MKKRICFIACPIGAENSPERADANFLLESIIAPAIEKDFEFVRSDLISSANKITDEITNHLNNDDLVIVDLSNHNPNVFYELGYRHALSKPTITFIKNNENIPFDLSDYRTIHYSENHKDVLKARKSLDETVQTFSEDDYSKNTESTKTNNSNDNNISRHLVDIKNDLSYIKDLILESPKQSNEDVPPDAMVRMMELAIQNPEQFEKIIELQNKSFDN